MSNALTSRFTLSDLRAARTSGVKVPMLTCYDYSMARCMERAGVPVLLVGDSAANVILGHDSTLPIPLSFIIELTAAVRRGSPNCLLIADMPFGTYQASVHQAVSNVCRVVKKTGCDMVKLEVAGGHAKTVRALSDAGVAVMAHLGLRPQAVGLLGGYKSQGRTAREAAEIVDLAIQMEKAGAAALLLEAVPPEVSERVVQETTFPVIGCGAGPACHGHVIVTQDGMGFSSRVPRFVPDLGDVAGAMTIAISEYVRQVRSGEYPAPHHNYEMKAEEKKAMAGLA
jgi:3-methyl-2-oxobutanoate hydroxymethyltransferase